MDEIQFSKFNKSLTKSEPNLPKCREINVTEYFGQSTDNNQSLIRQYSFKELRGHLQEFNQVFTSNHNNFGYSPLRNSPQISAINNDQFYKSNHDLEETLKEFNDSPMDIDQSEECVDVSMKSMKGNGTYCDNELKCLKSFNEKVKLKSEVLKFEETMKKEIRKRKGLSKKMIYSSILIVFLSVFITLGILIYNDVNLNDIQLDDIEQDLKLNVFNQNHVIDRLIFNLNKIHNNNEFKKVLILVGSTGVGKSLILNRLKALYPEKLMTSLNYQLNKDILEQKGDIFFTNKCFILTVDDLKINQLEIIENFIKSLQSQCVFIVLSFNIQETGNNLQHIVRYDQFKEISLFFTRKISFAETLMLNAMNKKHLEVWVGNVFKKRGLNPEKYNDFIKNLIYNHDVDNYGFKGIIPKINLLG